MKLVLIILALVSISYAETGRVKEVGGLTVVDGDAKITGQLSISSINNTFIGIGRNRVINGEMIIDQVNEGSAVTVNSSSEFPSADVFKGSGVGSEGVFTMTRSNSSPPTGYSNYLSIACTTADASLAATDRYQFFQLIEGYYIRDFLIGSSAAKEATLSFWVRSSLTGTYSGSYKNSAGNRSYPFEYTINSANTWELKTITATMDTTGTWLNTTGIGIQITWALAIGSNHQGTAGAWVGANRAGTTNQVNFMSSNTSRTWDITGVQLELGSTASGFEFRPFQIELNLCRRYYEKTFPIGVAVAQNSGFQRSSITYRPSIAGVSTGNGVMWNFQVEKRANPTITTYNPNAANANWRNATDGADSGAATVFQSGERDAAIGNAQAAGDAIGETVIIHATADARL